MKFFHKHHISFKNAFNGLIYSLTTQPNFNIHIFLSICAILLAIILQVSYIEMTILFLTIVIGLGAEMVNTSIECMTDLITLKWQKEAKIAKDVAAGMVLLVAFGAIMVAGLIFLPKIFNLIR